MKKTKTLFGLGLCAVLMAAGACAQDAWVIDSQEDWARTPATLDAKGLPAGYGFAFELKLTDTTENKSKPMVDRVKVEFE